MAEGYREKLSIKAPDTRTEVGKLSGGNQQKVMLAKWLETKPRVLIFDEPTRGIDVGAKAEVHGIIRALAAEGVAVLVISSDLPEVLALADRVLVMREGRQAGILAVEAATQERVIRLAAGRKGTRHDRTSGPLFAADPAPCGAGAGAAGDGAVLRHADRGLSGPAHVQPHHHLGRRDPALGGGQAIVVMTRNIDLSVGSAVGVVAYIVGSSLEGLPIAPGAGGGLLHGLGAVLGHQRRAGGLGPGAVDHRDLGTLALFRTFLVEWSDARTITTANLPQWLVDLPQATAFSIGDWQVRVTVVLAVGACLIAGAALAFLRPARRFYAVGSNPDAAAMAGINAARVVFVAFVISGAMAGLSGFLFLAKFGNITVVAGLGMELKSVAAVVVGGVSIMGGSGSMLGVLMGRCWSIPSTIR